VSDVEAVPSEPGEPPDAPDPEPEAWEPVAERASSCRSSGSSGSRDVDRLSWFSPPLGASPWTRGKGDAFRWVKSSDGK